MRDLICIRCNSLFQAGKGNFKYCPECRPKRASWYDKMYKKRPEFYDICPKCGGIKSVKTTMCFACRNASFRGENHPNWKGGRFVEPQSGYVMVRQGKKYTPEHRLIWEQTHHKVLPTGWIIHHLNGIRTDNHPDNLVAMPRKNHPHGTFIKALQKRIRELEQLRLI